MKVTFKYSMSGYKEACNLFHCNINMNKTGCFFVHFSDRKLQISDGGDIYGCSRF